MKKQRVRYNEGDWIAVPLPGGGHALGIIARKSRGGLLLGYFFGPRLERVPREEDTRNLCPTGAILVAQFGDLGILYGDWPLIGGTTAWNRTAWPLPDFGRIDSINPRVGYRVTYDEDALKCMREVRVSPEEAKSLPKDILFGYLALAITLDMMLGGKPNDGPRPDSISVP